MPDINMSSSDWGSLTEETKNAMAALIGNSFQTSAAASDGGITLGEGMPSYEASTDTSAVEAGADSSVVEAGAFSDAAKWLLKKGCKAACTAAQAEAMAACLALVETGPGVAACEIAVVAAGDYCRQKCDDL